MAGLSVNDPDSELYRCNFCRALCESGETQSGCLNKPIHALRVSCAHVLRELASNDCSDCKGTGTAYRFEDRCPIEGSKMQSKKVCLCVLERVE